MAYKSLILLAILFSTSHFLEAQGLFETRDTNKANLTTAQEKQYNRFDTNSVYNQIQLVEFGDIESEQDTGELPLILPFRSDTLLAHARNVQAYDDSSDFSWYGEIFQDSISGSALFMSRNDRTFGQINYGPHSYLLKALGDSLNVLIELDSLTYDTTECAVGDTSTAETIDTVEVRHDCDATVRVLVLFTEAAEAAGNPQDDAELFIQQTNQISRNSDLSPGHVHFDLAGVEQLEGFTESADIFDDRRDLRDDQNNPGSLREQHEADIVVLLTDGNYRDGVLRILGVAYLREAGMDDFAYAITEIDAAGGRFTFSHEVGHLFGARHNNDNTMGPNIATYANAHNYDCGWLFKREHRTVLNNLPAGEERIMHYSSPDVDHDCYPTGRDDRDNAQQIHDLACTVANYRDFNAPMNVYISGPRRGNNSGTYEWCAEVSHCTNVSSYEWEYSYDGFTYHSFGNTQCVSGSLPLDEDLHLRLTVTCANGETDIAWFLTLNTSKPEFFEKQKSELQRNSTSELVIYPNPVKSTLHGTFKISGANQVNEAQIRIINVLGETVDRFTVTVQNRGENTFTSSIGTLPPGYYQAIVRSGDDRTSTEAFIITK